MSKIKLKSLGHVNSIISFLLVLLGFSTVCMQGCREYGVPNPSKCKYTIKGQVQSQKDTLPIPNIQIILRSDTSYSDSKGNYIMSNESFNTPQTFYIQFNDIDDTLNGKYYNLDTNIILNNGETQKVLNIKLKPKK